MKAHMFIQWSIIEELYTPKYFIHIDLEEGFLHSNKCISTKKENDLFSGICRRGEEI